MQRQSHRIGRARTGKTILYMLLMGIVCAFIAAHLYGVATRVGLAPSTAARLPNYGFFAGLVLGLAISMVRSIKDIFAGLLVMVVLGSIFWFIGVLLEAVLVACGLDPDTASWISRIAFWLGMLIGSVTLYAIVRDMVDSWHQRLKGAR